MKRWLLFLGISLFITVFTACAKGDMEPVSSDNALTHSEPVVLADVPAPEEGSLYLKIGMADWGMTQEEVLSALHWSDSDWQSVHTVLDDYYTSGSRYFQYQKEGVLFFGQPVDVTFQFWGSSQANSRLTYVGLGCKTEEGSKQIQSILQELGWMNTQQDADTVDAVPIWDCGKEQQEHPGWAAYETYYRSQKTEQIKQQMGDATAEEVEAAVQRGFALQGQEPMVTVKIEDLQEKSDAGYFAYLDFNGMAAAELNWFS